MTSLPHKANPVVTMEEVIQYSSALGIPSQEVQIMSKKLLLRKDLENL